MSGEVAARGRELALRDPVAGRPIAVDLDAEGLTVEFTTTDGLAKPTIRLYADADVTERTTRTFDGDTWRVRLPRDGKDYGGGGGTTVIGNGSVMMSSFGRGGSSRVVVDGVDITDIVNERKGATAARMPRAVVHVPSGSVLVARVDTGDVTVTGVTRGVRVTSVSGSLRLGDGVVEAEFTTRSGCLEAGSVGAVRADTRNGDITIRGGLGPVDAETRNGSVKVFMLAPARVKAMSRNGDVDVDSAPGVSLAGMVLADSRNGSVRAPR